MNTLTLICKIAEEISVRHVKEGTLPIATTRVMWTQPNGTTASAKATCFGKKAEAMRASLSAGDTVLINAAVRIEKRELQSGKKQSDLEFVIKEVFPIRLGDEIGEADAPPAAQPTPITRAPSYGGNKPPQAEESEYEPVPPGEEAPAIRDDDPIPF